jgi:hypothetical protein
MATTKKAKSKAARKKTAKKKSVARRKPVRAAVKAARSKPAMKKRPPAASAPASRKPPAAAAPAQPAAAAPAARPAAPRRPAAAAPGANEERVGVVTHYYSQLSVAVVRLEAGSLRLGDTIHVKGHTSDFRQRVESMQIEHQPVTEVRAGQEFGLKVIEHAREHDLVYKVG